MTFIKFEHARVTDERWLGAGGDAVAVHLAAIDYCDQQLTDGRISVDMAPRVSLAVSPEAGKEAVKVLVKRGFWARDGRTKYYQIVDYPDYAFPAEQIVRTKARWKADKDRRRQHDHGDHALCKDPKYCPAIASACARGDHSMCSERYCDHATHPVKKDQSRSEIETGSLPVQPGGLHGGTASPRRKRTAKPPKSPKALSTVDGKVDARASTKQDSTSPDRTGGKGRGSGVVSYADGSPRGSPSATPPKFESALQEARQRTTQNQRLSESDSPGRNPRRGRAVGFANVSPNGSPSAPPSHVHFLFAYPGTRERTAQNQRFIEALQAAGITEDDFYPEDFDPLFNEWKRSGGWEAFKRKEAQLWGQVQDRGAYFAEVTRLKKEEADRKPDPDEEFDLLAGGSPVDLLQTAIDYDGESAWVES